MSKRLIIILALAFVVGIAFSAYAEVQNVKVSGDITALGIARNQFALQKKVALKNESAVASIVRLKIDADLTDNVIATVRLLNERYWGTEAENGPASGENSNIDLDLAYVTLKEFLYSPLTLAIGRQELHFGNDMIVGAIGTNRTTSTASAFTGRDEDLSLRKSFDAVRATLDYNPLVVDVIAAKVQENSIYGNNDGKHLLGINAKYDTGKRNTTIEGYLFSKITGAKNTVASTANGTSKADKIYTPGVLIKSQPVSNLTASFEAAYQFGTFYDSTSTPTATNMTSQRRAWATEAGVNYKFAKVKYTPAVTLLGAFFSGAKNPVILGNEGRKKYTGWDPMFENQKYGDIANALFAQTNVRLIGGIASVKPMDDVTLEGAYYAYWWDKKFPELSTTLAAVNVKGYTYLMRNKRYAGSELDLKATYDYTEDVQFSILGGYLWPGKSFDISNNAGASEVIGSMKVTF